MQFQLALNKTFYSTQPSLTHLQLPMLTSAPNLLADFPHVMAAGHAEDFQIYNLEQPWHLS